MEFSKALSVINAIVIIHINCIGLWLKGENLCSKSLSHLQPDYLNEKNKLYLTIIMVDFFCSNSFCTYLCGFVIHPSVI